MVLTIKLLSLIFLGLGVFIALQIALPIISYKIWEVGHSGSAMALATPLSVGKEVLGISTSQTSGNFPLLTSDRKRLIEAPYKTFKISIPKLDIVEAIATVDSNDIDTSLGHLPGTALPGEKGNMFISGHSSSLGTPQGRSFYKTIFSQLHKLEKGDKVTVSAGGQTFNYIILGFRIVDPKDLSVVEPPDNLGRYLSLMTCVPPGINTKRLVMIGKIE